MGASLLAVAKSIYYFLYITSDHEVKQYYLSYRPQTKCSISQFLRFCKLISNLILGPIIVSNLTNVHKLAA